MLEPPATRGEPEARNTAAPGVFRVSIVIPVYNGARTIGPLVDRLREELAGRHDLEVVLVNDGSADDSAGVCSALAERWPALVRFVDLAKNFGEHNAVMAGLVHTSGDCAVIMDDDFQNPPSEVAKLVEKLREGYDVVFSRYASKRHSTFRNLGSRFHNLVASVMLGKPRALYLSSFKAINALVIDAVTRYDGPYPYLDGLIFNATRRYATVEVQHDSRREGSSNYTLRRLVRLWLNMFTNFSILPLRLASLLGFVFAAVGLVIAVVTVLEKLANPDLPAGWASLMCVLLIVAGVQLFSLGMIGEYVGRLFLKVNGTPQFVVRRTLNCAPRAGRQRQ
jgi:undecaprenyl-phosphate 4-deoxy-4-formamido-L-arabinose transferase